jgi:hypothetical protein
VLGGSFAPSRGMRSNTIKTKKKQTFSNLVVVTAAGLRHLAFRDTEGKLRNFWNQTLVPLPAHILDPEN